MDSQSIFDIWKELATLTVNSIKEIDKGLEEQTLRLDVVYNNLLKSASKDILENCEPDKKLPKRQSKVKNEQVGDLFAAPEPSFQQPAIPPIRRTKRQASMMATDKIKNTRESATISSGPSTRASRARAMSFMDIAPLNCPKANSTFVVDKKFMDDIDECLSPEMFSPVTDSKTKLNPNATYNKPIKSTAINETVSLGKKTRSSGKLPENASPENIKNNQSKKIGSKKKSEEYLTKSKREKLEDIDVNIEEKSQHLTRTMKRKLQEEIQIGAKKTNVVHVPLEKQIFTPLKLAEEASLPTPHQVRENEAEKRKELHLKTKADQKKFDDVHLKVAKQREEQNKRIEEKAKKAAEEKKRKEEKQKEKEILMKKEALRKQKQTEQRLAEINAKRKQAEEAKKLKIETELKLKEAEMKKKNEIKPEKSKSIRPKGVSSNLPTLSVPKVATLPKSKIVKTDSNKNDYGLNDVSARDSSEDESGPKKQVPSWAKKENRKAVLEIQYHVESKERDLFFDCPKQMSLKEMFKGWNIRDRQRTSSAVWNTPPRYSEYIRRH